MHSRGRTLKFTAVLAMVVLALTGFSTGRHGRSSGGSGDGGGCSSSSQNHGSSSTTSGGGSSDSYDSDDDDYDSSYDDSSSTSGTSGGGYATRRPGYRSTPTSSSTGSGTVLKDGTAKLVSCATSTTAYATVEITNPNKREAEFQAWVTFYDAESTELLRNISVTVTVPAKGSANTRVKLGESFLASVDHCQVDPEADLVN
ncbi:hypothetical protein AB0H86_43130 [Streptomyces sp. NPDC050997]|uniref:hypothetical protein n=1 Tax=Streptomyces sp. NPDC050997 TaxID=3155519 RepID=UPI003444F4AD